MADFLPLMHIIHKHNEAGHVWVGGEAAETLKWSGVSTVHHGGTKVTRVMMSRNSWKHVEFCAIGLLTILSWQHVTQDP